jgi:NADH-quinone oxidoreductase subunit M
MPIPNILSVLTFLPLIGAVIILCLKRPQDQPDSHGDHSHDDHAEEAESTPNDPSRNLVNGVAMLTAVITFVLSLMLFFSFDAGFANSAVAGVGKHIQKVEDYRWITIGAAQIHYRMGVDGISMLLILLTTFLMVLCVGYSMRTKQRLKEFMVFLLLLETGMIGVFCALDLVLFYVFWEAMLIPMYFLIGIFGHERRIYAAVKFFLYTFAGSIFMLIAIIFAYQISGSFDLLEMTNPNTQAGAALRGFDPKMLMLLYGAFALAFMIKVPMFPFHTWLPDAHVEAPTTGSVILAGVMLKMGTYGFVRFCIPLFPVQAQQSAGLFITLAIIGIIYGSIVAAVQPDAKKLIAYSSVAHLGFVVLGIFSFTRVGMLGALIQNINHGISTPMLFFLIGMLYERRHTREISQYGGLKLIVPFMATMFLLATLSSVAVPFFNSFVGEFAILQGSFISAKVGIVGTGLAATGMILSAVYMLWWFQRIMLGPVTNPANTHLKDLSRSEWLVLTPLVVLIFWIGLGSPYWMSKMEVPVATLLPAELEMINTELPIATPASQASIQERLRNRSEEKPHIPEGESTAPHSEPAPITPPTDQNKTQEGTEQPTPDNSKAGETNPSSTPPNPSTPTESPTKEPSNPLETPTSKDVEGKGTNPNSGTGAPTETPDKSAKPLGVESQKKSQLPTNPAQKSIASQNTEVSTRW